ncbi:hypothetical protein UFOVP592_41 [uncultured Caudovirales phage]|uniref:Uncharacterized protein n=1 Tax=uncultured Caudovirales phage TaxID=2100421 RepID=A0A6J5MX45_9CAUD|nr:hypothetical protein UFOVP592_41 [uncultured Caudovirales phage]
MILNNIMSNQPEYLNDTDPEKNWDYYRQDHGGVITTHNGVADKLLQNNDLYNSMKGDWTRTSTNKSGNMIVTSGREDGKFYIKREQKNTEVIKAAVKQYRTTAEAGMIDPLAPIGDDGKLTYKWMDLPTVIAIRISDQYFDGIPWNALKNDRTLKAQFYRVVETEYPEYVCYPGGKLPIPVAVPYPTKKGEKKYFKGH